MGVPSPSSAPGAAASSMTFEEAARTLPMDGTADLPISWDSSEIPDTEQLLAARRSLVFGYWLRSSLDWSPIVPLGRFLHTEKHYRETLAPFADVTDAENRSTGPLWVKVMGVEETGTDQVRVTFCTDIGWWHRSAENKQQVRKNRANLESYVLKNVRTGDGEPRWLADQRFNPDGDREAKYGAQCTKWAQHQP